MNRGKKKFTIPKKAANSELLQNCDSSSREYMKVASEIERSLWNSKCGLKVKKVQTVNNDALSTEFNKRKLEMQKETSKRQEVIYGFRYVENHEQAKELCKTGLSASNESKISCLGDPKCGVYLSRCADILRRVPPKKEKNMIMVVFQIIKGRLKTIAEQHGSDGDLMEPTPSHDGHISKDFRKKEPSSIRKPNAHSSIFDSCQIYLYEINMELEDLYASRPRQCIPYAVVFHKFVEAAPPPESPVIEMQLKATGAKAPESHAASSKASESLESEEFFNAEIEKALKVWEGKLYNKSTSLTDVRIICHTREFSGHFPLYSNHLCVRMKIMLSHLKDSLPQFLYTSAPLKSKSPKVLKKGREYLHCEMYPQNKRSSTFARLRRSLQIRSEALLLKLPQGYDLLILPTCGLTRRLGITFDGYPETLHLLFTRKTFDEYQIVKKNESFLKDARLILDSRLLELEKLKLTTPVHTPPPVVDISNESESPFYDEEDWEQYPLFFTDMEKEAIRVRIQRARQAAAKEMIMSGNQRYKPLYKTPYFVAKPGRNQLHGVRSEHSQHYKHGQNFQTSSKFVEHTADLRAFGDSKAIPASSSQPMWSDSHAPAYSNFAEMAHHAAARDPYLLQSACHRRSPIYHASKDQRTHITPQKRERSMATSVYETHEINRDESSIYSTTSILEPSSMSHFQEISNDILSPDLPPAIATEAFDPSRTIQYQANVSFSDIGTASEKHSLHHQHLSLSHDSHSSETLRSFDYQRLETEPNPIIGRGTEMVKVPQDPRLRPAIHSDTGFPEANAETAVEKQVTKATRKPIDPRMKLRMPDTSHVTPPPALDERKIEATGQLPDKSAFSNISASGTSSDTCTAVPKGHSEVALTSNIRAASVNEKHSRWSGKSVDPSTQSASEGPTISSRSGLNQDHMASASESPGRLKKGAISVTTSDPPTSYRKLDKSAGSKFSTSHFWRQSSATLSRDEEKAHENASKVMSDSEKNYSIQTRPASDSTSEEKQQGIGNISNRPLATQSELPRHTSKDTSISRISLGVEVKALSPPPLPPVLASLFTSGSSESDIDSSELSGKAQISSNASSNLPYPINIPAAQAAKLDVEKRKPDTKTQKLIIEGAQIMSQFPSTTKPETSSQKEAGAWGPQEKPSCFLPLPSPPAPTLFMQSLMYNNIPLTNQAEENSFLTLSYVQARERGASATCKENMEIDQHELKTEIKDLISSENLSVSEPKIERGMQKMEAVDITSHVNSGETPIATDNSTAIKAGFTGKTAFDTCDVSICSSRRISVSKESSAVNKVQGQGNMESCNLDHSDSKEGLSPIGATNDQRIEPSHLQGSANESLSTGNVSVMKDGDFSCSWKQGLAKNKGDNPICDIPSSVETDANAESKTEPVAEKKSDTRPEKESLSLLSATSEGNKLTDIIDGAKVSVGENTTIKVLSGTEKPCINKRRIYYDHSPTVDVIDKNALQHSTPHGLVNSKENIVRKVISSEKHAFIEEGSQGKDKIKITLSTTTVSETSTAEHDEQDLRAKLNEIRAEKSKVQSIVAKEEQAKEVDNAAKKSTFEESMEKAMDQNVPSAEVNGGLDKKTDNKESDNDRRKDHAMSSGKSAVQGSLNNGSRDYSPRRDRSYKRESRDGRERSRRRSRSRSSSSSRSRSGHRSRRPPRHHASDNSSYRRRRRSSEKDSPSRYRSPRSYRTREGRYDKRSRRSDSDSPRRRNSRERREKGRRSKRYRRSSCSSSDSRSDHRRSYSPRSRGSNDRVPRKHIDSLAKSHSNESIASPSKKSSQLQKTINMEEACKEDSKKAEVVTTTEATSELLPSKDNATNATEKESKKALDKVIEKKDIFKDEETNTAKPSCHLERKVVASRDDSSSLNWYDAEEVMKYDVSNHDLKRGSKGTGNKLAGNTNSSEMTEKESSITPRANRTGQQRGILSEDQMYDEIYCPSSPTVDIDLHKMKRSLNENETSMEANRVKKTKDDFQFPAQADASIPAEVLKSINDLDNDIEHMEATEKGVADDTAVVDMDLSDAGSPPETAVVSSCRRVPFDSEKGSQEKADVVSIPDIAADNSHNQSSIMQSLMSSSQIAAKVLSKVLVKPSDVLLPLTQEAKCEIKNESGPKQEAEVHSASLNSSRPENETSLHDIQTIPVCKDNPIPVKSNLSSILHDFNVVTVSPCSAAEKPVARVPPSTSSHWKAAGRDSKIVIKFPQKDKPEPRGNLSQDVREAEMSGSTPLPWHGTPWMDAQSSTPSDHQSPSNGKSQEVNSEKGRNLKTSCNNLSISVSAPIKGVSLNGKIAKQRHGIEHRQDWVGSHSDPEITDGRKSPIQSVRKEEVNREVLHNIRASNKAKDSYSVGRNKFIDDRNRQRRSAVEDDYGNGRVTEFENIMRTKRRDLQSEVVYEDLTGVEYDNLTHRSRRCNIDRDDFDNDRDNRFTGKQRRRGRKQYGNKWPNASKTRRKFAGQHGAIKDEEMQDGRYDSDERERRFDGGRNTDLDVDWDERYSLHRQRENTRIERDADFESCEPFEDDRGLDYGNRNLSSYEEESYHSDNQSYGPRKFLAHRDAQSKGPTNRRPIRGRLTSTYYRQSPASSKEKDYFASDSFQSEGELSDDCNFGYNSTYRDSRQNKMRAVARNARFDYRVKTSEDDLRHIVEERQYEKQYREERIREERNREEQYREKQYREGQNRKEQYREERYREEQNREKQYREEQYREEQIREKQYMEEQYREEQNMKEQYREERYRGEQNREDQYREERYRGEQNREERCHYYNERRRGYDGLGSDFDDRYDESAKYFKRPDGSHSDFAEEDSLAQTRMNVGGRQKRGNNKALNFTQERRSRLELSNPPSLLDIEVKYNPADHDDQEVYIDDFMPDSRSQRFHRPLIEPDLDFVNDSPPLGLNFHRKRLENFEDEIEYDGEDVQPLIPRPLLSGPLDMIYRKRKAQQRWKHVDDERPFFGEMLDDKELQTHPENRSPKGSIYSSRPQQEIMITKIGLSDSRTDVEFHRGTDIVNEKGMETSRDEQLSKIQVVINERPSDAALSAQQSALFIRPCNNVDVSFQAASSSRILAQDQTAFADNHANFFNVNQPLKDKGSILHQTNAVRQRQFDNHPADSHKEDSANSQPVDTPECLRGIGMVINQKGSTAPTQVTHHPTQATHRTTQGSHHQSLDTHYPTQAGGVFSCGDQSELQPKSMAHFSSTRGRGDASVIIPRVDNVCLLTGTRRRGRSFHNLSKILAVNCKQSRTFDQAVENACLNLKCRLSSLSENCNGEDFQ